MRNRVRSLAVGWALLVGMALFATALTLVAAGRRVRQALGQWRGDPTPEAE